MQHLQRRLMLNECVELTWQRPFELVGASPLVSLIREAAARHTF
jgi:hypothetical protein